LTVAGALEVALKTSIIVCTRNRSARLQIMLASLAEAEFPPGMELEVIVVNDGSTDDTNAVVNTFAGKAPFRVSLFEQEGRGLAVARNRGLREASGELLLFLDDDCVVSREYLCEVAARFAADDRLVLRGGRVLLGDPADAPITIRTSLKKERLLARRDPAGFVLGANMAMKRAVADRIGPFDERFGAGGMLRAAEDTDYLVRAQLARIAVEYVPDMTVYHHHGRRTAEAVLGVYRNYGVGNGALTMKHALRAPWLARARYWTVRNAVRERFGGPLFAPDLGLSNGRVAAHNLIGAWLFVLAKLRGAAPWPKSARSAVRTVNPVPSAAGRRDRRTPAPQG
jgi:glycosyltransferase involved in cell wall biosynthesis